jgi:hypothetical protein
MVLFIFKIKCFGDWILSLSSGGTYSGHVLNKRQEEG